MSQLGYIDGVVLDIHHHVIETTMANLFWITNGQIFTPALDQAGVAGVIRRVVSTLAQEEGWSVSEGHYSLEKLLSADEVFITNSVLGVAPVTRIRASEYHIGVITREIQKRVNVC